MPIALTVNGVTYNYPKLGDENWGQDATNWAVGITQLTNSIDTLITNTLLTGIYEFANGSAFTPSLRFQNSLATGIYRVSADTLGFTAAGVAAGQISSGGLLRWKDGSAAAPAYSFVADDNTGVYRIGADQLGLSTGGLLALKIDAAQAVTLYGDLTVQGTTTLNSVIVQAVDKNLTLNLNGTDVSAEGGGLTIFRNPSTSGSIVFDSTLASLWKAGLVGSEVELVNLSAPQTLTNKTLTTPVINGIASSLVPTNTNTYDLGSSSLRWQNLYVATDVYLSRSLFGDGSAAAPSITFESDTDTGLYRSGSNKINIATGGLATAEFGNSGASRYLQFLTASAGVADITAGQTNGELSISGSNASSAGRNIRLYSNSHATKANQMEFRAATTVQGLISSAGAWTLGSSGGTEAHTINGQLVVTGQLQASNGSVATPSISFASDTDTGIYRSNTNLLALVAGGAHKLEITTASLIGKVPFLAQDGSTSAPSISFESDTDTGLYRSGANILGFTTNSISAGTIDANQKWTLGNASGVQIHDVNGKGLRLVNAPNAGPTLDALQGAVIADNQTTPTVIFTFTAANNEAIVVHFSLARGTTRETGTMHIVNNGSSADLEVSGRTIGEPGVTFSVDISGGNVRLLYTSTSTGVAGTIKYFTIRWTN